MVYVNCKMWMLSMLKLSKSGLQTEGFTSISWKVHCRNIPVDLEMNDLWPIFYRLNWPKLILYCIDVVALLVQGWTVDSRLGHGVSSSISLLHSNAFMYGMNHTLSPACTVGGNICRFVNVVTLESSTQVEGNLPDCDSCNKNIHKKS